MNVKRKKNVAHVRNALIIFVICVVEKIAKLAK